MLVVRGSPPDVSMALHQREMLSSRVKGTTCPTLHANYAVNNSFSHCHHDHLKFCMLRMSLRPELCLLMSSVPDSHFQSQGQAGRWLRALEGPRGLVILDPQMPDLVRQLENAIQYGRPVIIQVIPRSQTLAT